LALFERSDSLGMFDAMPATCVTRSGMRALVSADGSFAGIPKITHVVPDRAGLSSLRADR